MLGFRWPFRGTKRRQRTRGSWELSLQLLGLSRYDAWTLGNAVEGTIVMGATGSGKSSGSGRAIALAFLRAGFGGLVLTAKSDERQQWETYCRETGRLDDLIILGPNQPWRFNFLAHEHKRKGVGAGLVENIVNLLCTVSELGNRGQGQGGGREDDRYWRDTMRELSRAGVEVLMFAKDHVSVPDLYRLLISAPNSPEEMHSEEWRAHSFCFQCLQQADKCPKSKNQAEDFATDADFFLIRYPTLAAKTRSIIVSTLTSMTDVLNRGILRELLCTDTNLTPEAMEDGKIILLDLPVKEYGAVGVYGQGVVKYTFQRSIERRNILANPRPVFLWADECQNFLTSYDAMFQTTCRSARVATVLLSQNVNVVYSALGGTDRGKAEANSLFGNLNTKIWHANSDPETNEWAASLIGRTRQFFVNANSTNQPTDGFSLWGDEETAQSSAGVSEQLSYELEPSVFSTLRTGGVEYGGQVDAIVFRNGKRFAGTGRNWLPVTFQQAF